jgi:uncharacterized protein (DUF2249 family)
MTQTRNTERVIDVADIEPRFRHSMIGQLLKHLEPEHSLQIVVDHDPQRLRFYLDLAFGTLCDWSYRCPQRRSGLEQGPDVWRVRLRHRRAGDTAVSKDADVG